jgi:antitoxin HigA-1
MMSEPRHLDPITPGEILKLEFMEPLGISQNQLARDLDVPAGRINEIIRGKRSLTADTALRLERCFGVSAQFWLNLQTRYELKIARSRLWRDIDSRVRPRRSA